MKRYLVDFITDLYRSNDIIYAANITDCISKFNQFHKNEIYMIIRIQDLQFKLP